MCGHAPKCAHLLDVVAHQIKIHNNRKHSDNVVNHDVYSSLYSSQSWFVRGDVRSLAAYSIAQCHEAWAEYIDS